MKKYYLLAPGPTSVPAQVLSAMAQPVLHHRTLEFESLFARVREGLQRLMDTKGDVITLAASGTGALEAAVANCCASGDRVLVARAGKFGERWGEICHAYGLSVTTVNRPYGEAITSDEIADALARDPGIRAVFSTQSETSTGVLHDIKGYAEAVRGSGAILIVDAVSSLGAVPLPMEAWGVDVVVAGSQKGLMLPPGLAIIGVADRVWERVDRSDLPKYYFNLKAERKMQQKNQALFTPAVSLIAGLKVALDMLFAEGLENVFNRHDRLARATRAGVEALGLGLFAKATPSPTVTAVVAPRGIDGEKIVKAYSQQHNITIAGGQGEMKGKLFRLAHLGYVGEFDVITGLSALEMILSTLGVPVDLGAGVRAAEKIFAAA